MSLSIQRPGFLSTLQDGGRWGHQRDGIQVNGPMDAFAHRMANMLAGNADQETALEICLTGPAIKFEKDHLIAITGHRVTPRINGRKVKTWRPLWVQQESLLTFDKPLGSRFAYLAVAGGIRASLFLGSTATDLKMQWGGYGGRALKAGDLLSCPGNTRFIAAFLHKNQQNESAVDYTEACWTPAASLVPAYHLPPIVHAMRGPEWNLFTTESQQAFFQDPFTLSTQSDRMGYRLSGPELQLGKAVELLSSAVTFGTVQVPPGGGPIALMADHQTTGGYPRIAQVATTALPLLAQALPGIQVRFQEVTLQQAHQQFLVQERQLQALRSALGFKFHHYQTCATKQ